LVKNVLQLVIRSTAAVLAAGRGAIGLGAAATGGLGVWAGAGAAGLGA